MKKPITFWICRTREYYIALCKKPAKYSRTLDRFKDKENYNIVQEYLFCPDIFEEVTGVKFRVGQFIAVQLKLMKK